MATRTGGEIGEPAIDVLGSAAKVSAAGAAGTVVKTRVTGERTPALPTSDTVSV